MADCMLRSYLPEDSWLIRAHAAAIRTGEIVEGEDATIAVVPGGDCQSAL